MLLREIFIGGARAPPAPPHATALKKNFKLFSQWSQEDLKKFDFVL